MFSELSLLREDTVWRTPNLVKAMQETDGDGDPPERAKVTSDRRLPKLELKDFASQDSMKFFSITGIPCSCLDKDPSLWACDDIRSGQKIASNLKVVNDCAKRAL